MLVCFVLLNLLVPMLLLESQQCSTLASLVMGLVSAIISNIPIIVTRLVFAAARPRRARRAYVRHERERKKLFAAISAQRAASIVSGCSSSRSSNASRSGRRGSGGLAGGAQRYKPRKETGASTAHRSLEVSSFGGTASVECSGARPALIGGMEPPSAPGEKQGVVDIIAERLSRCSLVRRGPDQKEGTAEGRKEGEDSRGHSGDASERSSTSHDVERTCRAPGARAHPGAPGGRGATSNGAAPCSATVRPEQLLLLADGISVGLRLHGGAELPVRRVGVPWRQLLPWREAHFVVEYEPLAACGTHDGAGALPGSGAAAHCARMCVGAAPFSLSRGASQHMKAKLHSAQSSGNVLRASSFAHIAAEVGRPPMTRWGWSERLTLAWACVGPLAPVTWLLIVLLWSVAVPLASERQSHGMSEEDWRARLLEAAAFGLFNRVVVLDTLKVFAIVLTSPALAGSLLKRLRNRRLRDVAWIAITCVHTPLSLLL